VSAEANTIISVRHGWKNSWTEWKIAQVNLWCHLTRKFCDIDASSPAPET
jgi:hypothetical protein